ncbi:MAG: hypothetical protein ACOYYS_28135 [Chloroflexota bacterium]
MPILPVHCHFWLIQMHSNAYKKAALPALPGKNAALRELFTLSPEDPKKLPQARSEKGSGEFLSLSFSETHSQAQQVS